MQIHDPLPVELEGLKDVNIHNHGFLPIAEAYCRRLGLVELVNSMISTQSKIVTELGLRAASTFQLDLGTASYDTTSTNVWGEYRACEGEETPEGPVITYGYSKDHQPQLKQFMTELLCVDRGVPIFGRTLDGNSSDP
jgi:hypothetical protein